MLERVCFGHLTVSRAGHMDVLPIRYAFVVPSPPAERPFDPMELQHLRASDRQLSAKEDERA